MNGLTRSTLFGAIALGVAAAVESGLPSRDATAQTVVAATSEPVVTQLRTPCYDGKWTGTMGATIETGEYNVHVQVQL
jgi:hypothetical protein